MATPSHADDRTWLPSAAETLTPTVLAEGACDANRDTSSTLVPPTAVESGNVGLPNGLRTPDPTGEAVKPDGPCLPHGEDGQINHASTPPIPVPQSTSAMGLDHSEQQDGMGGEPLYVEESPLDQYMRNRRPSISFHPKVTLDTGHQRALAEALPSLSIDTKPSRRQPLLHEARYPTRSPLFRVQSEADTSNYDSTTGEHIETTPRQEHPAPPTFMSVAAPSSDLETKPTNIPTPEPRVSSESDQGISLTSDSTASPVLSEIQTPVEAMDLLLSPITSFPPLSFPVSLEESSAWPKPRRQHTSSGPKSYDLERGMSMRSAQRVSSRRSTRQSSSSVMSPATTFLSRFARQESPPEPDGEGQEVGEYVLGKQVGYGGFSSVREAFTIEGDEKICRAVKVVRRQIPGKEELENEQIQAEFEREVSTWRCLGHRNILPLIEVYETNFATFCFTKLNTGGTLFDVVKRNRQGISRDLARRYAYQLASAVRYLHEDVRVVHRDIKLENCLIDVSDSRAAEDGGNVLLCDFGLAEFVTNDPVRGSSPDPRERMTDRPPTPPLNLSETATSIAGSLQYASPELILSPAGFVSSVVDVWAFGVVLYALLVGDLPFQHTFQPRVQMMILAGEWNAEALEKAPGVVGYEEEVLEMMRGCLQMDSTERWTISQVLGCQWLKGCQEQLEELNESFKL